MTAALAWPAVAAALCLALSAGCASRGSPAGHSQGRPTLGARYLAIAVPANRMLDHAVEGFNRHRRHDLAVAESYLRAQAATERWFDRRLLRIAFPARIAAVARALVRANQSRIRLTELQARSGSIAKLLSFTGRHKAADAAVEAQVRVIRRELGLAPPSTS